MGRGFLKLIRGEKTAELMRDPNCFLLASVIAYRARRNGTFSVHNLQLGEAMLGDHGAYGMSEQQYRTAKKKLEQWGIATFQATNRGTIGKLVDTSIYDINAGNSNEPGSTPATSQQQTNNERSNTPATTNKELKNPKNTLSESALSLAALLNAEIKANTADFEGPEDITGWAAEIERLIRKGRDPKRIADVICYAQGSEFWRMRIMNAKALVNNFSMLRGQCRQAQEDNRPKVKLAICARCGIEKEADSMRQVSGRLYCGQACKIAALGW